MHPYAQSTEFHMYVRTTPWSHPRQQQHAAAVWCSGGYRTGRPGGVSSYLSSRLVLD